MWPVKGIQGALLVPKWAFLFGEPALGLGHGLAIHESIWGNVLGAFVLGCVVSACASFGGKCVQT